MLSSLVSHFRELMSSDVGSIKACFGIGRWLYNLPPPRRFRSSSLFIALVGISSVLVASKYEEIWAPE
ncbi:hypothetical protein P8452_63910 [Trifolium repens]|nr:hypothetical protein P8452_60274 [Trifolium repens]WJX80975.1 hypothetical protein P8452_63910 [Trifolium repens]